MNPQKELDWERQHHRRCLDALAMERTSLRSSVETALAARSADQAAAARVLAQRLDAIETAKCPLFFGRIFNEDGTSHHIGRIGLSSNAEPIVVDWRADAAVPYYRATAVDPVGVDRRRHYSFDDCELAAYSDESLTEGEGGGLPDPVLAAMSAERHGQMRDIAQTIQGEQDAIIRDDLATSVLVEGGPGTGKTAVGLHRAAFIAYQWRRRDSTVGRSAMHQGDVLVLGPNERFLDYINDVLPSLGEREVTYRSYGSLPSSPSQATNPTVTRTSPLLLDDRIAQLLNRWLRERSAPAITAPLRVHAGSRSIALEPDELAELRASSLNLSSRAYAEMRAHFRSVVRARLAARSNDFTITWPPEAKSLMDAAMPALVPKSLLRGFLAGRADVWQHAAGLLSAEEQAEIRRTHRDGSYEVRVVWDEIEALLRSAPRQFDHVVADEVQDLSRMELRMIRRRVRKNGSVSLLGDRAQTTSPCGAWDRIPSLFGSELNYRTLSVGYRVPENIMLVANALLDHISAPGVRTKAVPGRTGTVHLHGSVPSWLGSETRWTEPGHSACLIGSGLGPDERSAVERRAAELGIDVIADAVESKGLEFDYVIYADSWATLARSGRAAEGFVAITRAVRELVAVSSDGMPDWVPARIGNGRGLL